MKKKHRICSYPIAAVLAIAGLGERAWSDTYSATYTPGSAVTGIGTSSVQTVSGSTVNVITGVTVNLDITGNAASGYTNGDIYAYLRLQNPGGEAITILLNAVGTTSSNPFGYADTGGFNITLSDTATNGDVHLYQNSQAYPGAPVQPYTLTGTWQPDGRDVTPPAEDTVSRTNLLSQLNGLSANGTWTLYVLDDAGATATITSWGLNITGTGGPFYWSGASGTSWATVGSGATNWSTAASGGTPILAIPTSISDVVFATGTAQHQGATTLDQDFTIHSLTDTDTTPVVISSGTGGTHTLTISNTGSTAITVGTGSSLTINANVTLAGTSNGIEVDGTGQATINGALGGTIGLLKTGGGLLSLNGVNTYSGATTISAGTIQFNNNAALSTGTVTLGDSNTAANNVALLATAPMNSDNGTIGGGAIANNIVVSASGTGTATIGTTTFAGSGNGGFDSTTFTGTLTLNRATTLQSGDSDRTTFTGVISGNVGTLTVDGGARVLIGPTADNTFTGNVQVTGSGTILQLGGSNNTLNGNSVDLGAGTTLYVTKDNGAESIDALTGSGSVSTNGSVMQTLTVGDNGGGGTYSGVIDDGNSTLAILKSGAGTQVFTGASTYSGGTEVSGGTLQLGDGSTTGASLGSGTVLVDSKGTFTLNLASGETFSNAVTDNGHVIADDSPLSNYTISSIISGSGDFTKSGGNTVTVTGANTYQGGTTISGGTLRLGDGVTTGAALGTAGVTIDNNATLTFALASGETFSNGITDNGHIIADFRVPANNYTIASNITGSGDFTKNDANTVTLTGNNSYQNGTTINGGTLLVNNTAGSGTGSGTVLVNASGTLGGSGTISGPVTLNGTVSPGAGTPGTAGTTLHTGAVTWNGGGALNLQLGAGTVNDMLAITGALTKGTTGTYTINITNDGATQPDFTLATYSSTNFLASDFSLALPSGFTGALAVTGTQLDLLLTFAGSGNIIENAPPIDTPLFADFTVNGPVYTAGGNNTIRTLTFTPGSSLQIFDTLYVTQGPVILVNGATITLNGNLSTSELELLYGSLLNGNGSILGDLINGGVVSPGHSPGIIRVSGNYTQLPAGLLKIEIGGQNLSQHDLLGVNGTARLGGTLQLVQLNNFKLQRNDSITFLTANGGVIGRFDNVVDDFVTNTIIQPTVVYSTHGVALEGQQGSFKKFAVHANLPPNVQAVGGMLDSAVNDRRANSLINYLDARILSKLPEDLAKISPDALTSVFTIGTSLATVQSQNLQRRTDDLRSGASGFNAANLAINGDGPSFSGGFDITTGVAGPNGPLDDGKEVKEMKQVAPAENRWGAFLSGTGDWVSVGDTNNARGYELESGGFTLGVDYKVCPNFAIGLMAGYTGTTSDLANNGRVYVNGGKVGVYATTFVGGWYADVAAFGGYDSYDTRRAGLLGDARGSTEGGNVNALFGTGYDFKKGGFTFGPTASFNYTYVGTSAFNEYGSLAPLDIHGGGSESLRSAFGIKASYDWKVGGVTIKPEVRAAWQHEYGDAAYGLDASLASGAGSSFTVNGPQLGRDSALIGAGFAIQCSDRVSTYFYYDGELGRKNYESNAVTGGIRLAF